MKPVKLGKMNQLRVIKEVDHGFYLQGDESWNEILLPRKLATEGLEIDDEIDVFVHFDSKDMIVATTQVPFAQVGDFAVLKVSSVEKFGAFLDWGLDKELFVPFREQLFKMTPGESYVVYLYIDKSNRIAASTRISQFIDKNMPKLKVGEEVGLLPYHKTEMGIKAVINGQYSGLIYEDDIRHDLKLGQKMKGYIQKIRNDNKIDLSLQAPGLRGRKGLSQQILEKLKASGGTLPVTAKTPADTISEMFGVSRKKFKIALGFLYKNNLISIEDDKIILIQKP